jgi:hypothetical protein
VVTNEEGSLGVGYEPSTVRASSGNRLLRIFLAMLITQIHGRRSDPFPSWSAVPTALACA